MKSRSRFRLWSLLTLCALLSTPTAFAAEKREILTLESVRIRGDQESPMVVYIVPWQPVVQYGMDSQHQVNAVLRPLEPLDRESFQRMLSYHQLFQLQVKAEQKAPTTDAE